MKTILETDPEYECDIQAPCFQFLSPEEIELVKASKTQVLFRKGDNLTKQGAFVSYILFIIEGLARQYIEFDNSRNYNLRVIQPGEFVGLFSVFGGNTFNYSSVAITDTKAFLVEKQAIMQISEDNSRFGFNILRRYCEQNTNLVENLRTVMFKQMNGRLADILLYLDGIHHQGKGIFNLFSRRDIAEFAGMSVESTVKLLKTFEKEGLIRLADKDIEILRRAGMEEISRIG